MKPSVVTSIPSATASDAEAVPDAQLLLSCLLDGELDDAQREVALRALAQNEEAQRQWAAMHVIGDALRSSEVGCLHRPQFQTRMAACLAAEPRIVAPRWRRERVLRRVVAPGMAIAAAVTVLGVVVLPQFRVFTDSPGAVHVAAEKNQAPLAVAQESGVSSTESSGSDVAQLHRYLQAHREFVPTSGVLPPSTPYLRTSTTAAPGNEP